MTGSKLIRIDRITVVVFTVMLASVVVNVFIKCGLGFEYMCLGREDLCSNEILPYSVTILYVLFTRLKQLIFIILLMKIINTDIVYNILMIFIGGIFGVFATIQTYYGGLTGLAELLLFLLPHCIFYLLLLFMIYSHYKNWSKENFQIGKIMFCAVIFCTGVVCEGFFSRIFLENFYQHIVIKM